MPGTNVANIIAGVAGGGTTGTDFMWVAPVGTAAPTNTSTALNAAFKSTGAIDPSGLAKKVSESRKEISMFGSLVPARTLLTGATETYDITMLETNVYSLSVYKRYPLAGAGAIVPGVGTGVFEVQTGAQSVQFFAVVFWVVDGANAIRYYCPNVQVTARKDQVIAAGSEISYGVTMTAYPGASDGVACHEFYLIPSLG